MSWLSDRVRILRPLRHTDFRLLWTGMTASLIGDGIFLVALAWQVYELSNVPTALSIVGVAMTLPQIVFLLIGGVVSDRFDRRWVMIAADALRAVSVAALGMLSIGGVLEIWHIMIVAAAFGAGTAFFGPAFDAIVPQLVPGADLNQANSLDQFVRPAAARMLGPAVGGWLIGIWGGDPGPAFLIDALTFVLSIACVARMRAREIDRSADEPKTAFQDVKEGFRFVRSRVWLWGTFLAATLAYLIFWGPSEVLLPFIVKNHMHGSASDLGFILALGGVGAMFAAVVMGNRDMPRRHITFMYGVWTLSTLAVAGYGLASFPWQAMVASFVFNALEGAGTIVWATTKGRLVPERLLGVSRASTGSSRSASCPSPSRSPAPWPLCSGPGRPSSARASWVRSSRSGSCSCRGCGTSSAPGTSRAPRRRTTSWPSGSWPTTRWCRSARGRPLAGIRSR